MMGGVGTAAEEEVRSVEEASGEEEEELEGEERQNEDGAVAEGDRTR